MQPEVNAIDLRLCDGAGANEHVEFADTTAVRNGCRRHKRARQALPADKDQMSLYKYETHLHTSETSRCSTSGGADLAHYFKARGYTGIFVTDHFLGSNTTVPENLPWNQRIDMFMHGYEAAAREGAKIGLDVFFAWEYGQDWTHLLTYGLDKDWLLANPDMLNWDIIEYFDRVHAAGGAIVHAHPFRENVECVRLFPTKTDAVEVINSSRNDDANRHALDFALSFTLPQAAGSDIHHTDKNNLAGVFCRQRLSHPGDYIAALRAGTAVIFDEQQ